MWIAVAILGAVVALLQSTFIPAVKMFGGMIELELAIILLFLFYGSLREASIFFLIFAFFSTIFSQIPIIYFLLPGFVVIVIFIFLSRRRIIIRPGTLMAFPLFFLAVVVADLIRLLVMARFSFHTPPIILADALLTAFAATIIYWTVNRIYHFLNPQIQREKIKLLE